MDQKKLMLSQEKGTNNGELRSNIVNTASYTLFGEFIKVFANQNPLQESDGSREHAFSFIVSSPYDIGQSTTHFSPEIELHRNNTVKLIKRIMEGLRDILNTTQETNKSYRVVEFLDGFSYPKNPHHHITLAQEGVHLETVTKKARGGFLTNTELGYIFGSQKFFNAIYQILDNEEIGKQLESLEATDRILKRKLAEEKS